MNRWHQDYRLQAWLHRHADLVIAITVFLILALICGAAYLIDGVK